MKSAMGKVRENLNGSSCFLGHWKSQQKIQKMLVTSNHAWASFLAIEQSNWNCFSRFLGMRWRFFSNIALFISLISSNTSLVDRREVLN